MHRKTAVAGAVCLLVAGLGRVVEYLFAAPRAGARGYALKARHPPTSCGRSRPSRRARSSSVPPSRTACRRW